MVEYSVFQAARTPGALASIECGFPLITFWKNKRVQELDRSK